MAANNADLTKALQLLIKHADEKSIKIVLVGALVPAVLLMGPIKGLLRVGGRETRDADSVINIESWDEWREFVGDLIQLGFTRAREEHRLLYGEAYIDLIPYGDVVTAEETLTWPISGFTMNVIGVSDALTHSIPTEVLPDVSLPVAPLWSFVVLKIAAYRDRSYPRDLSDIIFVLDGYEKYISQSRRYDVMDETQGITFEQAGAYLLGQDLKTRGSRESLALSKEFLRVIEDQYHSVISTILRDEKREYSDSRRAYVFSLIRALQLGME